MLYGLTLLLPTSASLTSSMAATLATDVSSTGASHTIFDLLMGSGPVVRVVLLALVVMSITTWGIVFAKTHQFGKSRRQSLKFSDVFWGSRNLAEINQLSQSLDHSSVATVFCAGYRELMSIVRNRQQNRDTEEGDFGDIENIDRALKRAKAEELTRLEHWVTFLATTASAAPFIGLFGTVWGIMNAFIGLSAVKTTSIQAVAPGISEALIATAVGLAAAIPAAIAYNYFSQQIKIMSRSMDMFSAEFLNIVRNDFLRG